MPSVINHKNVSKPNMNPLKHKYISQLKPVRNSLMHQPVTVSSNARSQMHVQIKHFLAYLQDLIPTVANIKIYIHK